MNIILNLYFIYYINILILKHLKYYLMSDMAKIIIEGIFGTFFLSLLVIIGIKFYDQIQNTVEKDSVTYQVAEEGKTSLISTYNIVNSLPDFDLILWIFGIVGSIGGYIWYKSRN